MTDIARYGDAAEACSRVMSAVINHHNCYKLVDTMRVWPHTLYLGAAKQLSCHTHGKCSMTINAILCMVPHVELWRVLPDRTGPIRVDCWTCHKHCSGLYIEDTSCYDILWGPVQISKNCKQCVNTYHVQNVFLHTFSLMIAACPVVSSTPTVV